MFLLSKQNNALNKFNRADTLSSHATLNKFNRADTHATLNKFNRLDALSSHATLNRLGCFGWLCYLERL